MSGFYDRGSDLVRFIYDARIATPPVLDMETYFPAAAAFAGHWEALRDEAVAIARSRRTTRFEDLMPEQTDIASADGRQWCVFLPKIYGLEVPQNMALCPTLARLLRESPDVLTATLSYLAPRKTVPTHRGPFRGIIRYYLALQVPLDESGEPAAVLTVDGVDHRLRDGEHLLWDDTYPHAVRNDSDAPRVVLLLDIWRPGMPADLVLLSRLVAWGVRTAVKRRGLLGRIDPTGPGPGTTWP